MDGIFLRKKFNLCLFLLFIGGLFLIGMYFFIIIVDPEATSTNLTILITGTLICLTVIASWLWNYGAFIHIGEDSIEAKYHWFGKISCKLSDVTYAFSQRNTLTIQSKNGKTCTIFGLTNSHPLASFIRRKMYFELAERPETLIRQLSNLKSARKKESLYTCSGAVLMFVNIFITDFLTDGKELYEYNKIQWIIFSIMSLIEIATTIGTFHFALKAGKKNICIDRLQYTIRRTIIETYPLLPGYAISVYTDDDYIGRITVFGYHLQNDVYYSVQKFDAEYNLLNVYTSEIYASLDEIAADLNVLINITEKVLH